MRVRKKLKYKINQKHFLKNSCHYFQLYKRLIFIILIILIIYFMRLLKIKIKLFTSHFVKDFQVESKILSTF